MDEELNTDGSIEELADAFLKHLDDEPEVEADEQDDAEDEAEVEDTSDDDDEGSSDDDESDDDDDSEDEATPKVAEDDAEVTVTVDGKETKFAVKDLKRLAGQEASLTQKSQHVADQARTIEAQSLYLANVLDTRVKAAQARVEKYAKVDLWSAHRDLEPEEFEALKSAKESAEAEFATVTTEAQEFLQRAHATRNNVIRARAATALTVLTKTIPEWSDDLYGSIRTYAVSQGMATQDANETVDPSVIVMAHKAMKYDEAQRKTAAVVKKVTKAPKSVVKKSANASDATTSKLKQVQRAAAKSGDIDDVAAAFLAASKS